MKKALVLVAFLTTIVSMASLYYTSSKAESSGALGNLNWILDDKGVLVISGQGSMNTIYASTPSWHSEAENITQVIIEEGVTSIGGYAFSDCTHITSIILPDTITSIGNSAFRECNSLISINIPDGVTEIGISAFWGCSSLNSIIIPNSVTIIERYLFTYCTNLSNVTLPESISTIDFHVFYGCDNLSHINLPNNATSIDKEAFTRCEAILYAEYGSKTALTLSKVGYSFCRHGDNYQLKYIFNDNQVSGVEILSITENNSYFRIPDFVTRIGEKAFYRLTNLKNVSIPSNVIDIGNYAFYSCSNLACITIPASITSIGDNAFFNCSQLTDVFILGNELSFGNNVFSYKPTIYCYEYTDADSYATDNNYQSVYLDNYNPKDSRTISFDGNQLHICASESILIKPMVFPDYDHPTVMWNSSNPAVAIVNDGIITGISIGSCTITATVDNASTSMDIIVYLPATDFSFVENEIWAVAKEPLTVLMNVLPDGAFATFTWNSDDVNVAAVDEHGAITTKKPGDVTITATMDSSISHNVLLHVCYPVSEIVFENSIVTLKRSQQLQLVANITMRSQNCTNHLVNFTSSDESVVTVDSKNGLLTAHAPGTAIITATASNGINESCNVIVQELNTLILPDTLTRIDRKAFANLAAVDAIKIPASVISIASDAFEETNATLIVKAGSYAETWAINNDVQYAVE